MTAMADNGDIFRIEAVAVQYVDMDLQYEE